MDNILLEVGGKEFYFDIDKLAGEVQYENESENKEVCEDSTELPTLKIDVTKYEMY